jgi:signal transduction histidine kinase
MPFLFETLIPALESPQGGAFYALIVLAVLSSASLLLHNRARPAKLDRRVNIGLGVLMGLRLIELPVFLQAWLGEPMAIRAQAPLERGILLASLVVLAWLWARPNGESRGKQVLFAAELIGALAVTAILFYLWQDNALGATFNYSDLDYGWGMASLLVIILGGSQILSSSQPKRLGLLHMGILFIGQALHIFLAEPFGNMPLLVQAANLIGLPLLFMLEAPKQQMTAARVNNEPQESFAAFEEAGEPAFSMPAFFDLEEPAGAGLAQASGEPTRHPAEELARETAEELGADLCILATLNEAQMQLELEYGYNLLRSAPVEMARIPLREVPRLTSSLKRDRILRLPAEPRLSELAAISQALRLSFPGNLLAAPFGQPRDLRRWAVLLLSLEQPWELEDEVALEQRLANLGSRLSEALGVRDEPVAAPVATVAQEELERTRQEVEELAAENERYRQDVERLLAHIDELSQAQPIDNAPVAADAQNELVQALQLENGRLKSAIASLEASNKSVVQPGSIDASQAKAELRLALEELASLQARLDAAQQAVLEGNNSSPQGNKIDSDQVEVIASIAQELRQPLSSILGYTDLLLGESVGILGALQRKFLERVRNSTERMNTLIDDLIRIAELDRTGYSVTRSAVDLSAVIDDAIGQLRAQLQEKRISLRVDLPRQLPELNTDKDALQQILYHLLQNADAATPADGAITLRAFVEEQPELGEFVLIQVSDTGSGIPEEDLPRVFSRLYRSSNPVIQGVGDTGVGLTIAETLTQALGGRIWVESSAGMGATFSVLLPLKQEEAPQLGNI